jgi:hypothetical protein
MVTNQTQTELVESIVSALKMSGLLFQTHPAHPEWKATRPGASSGEVARFVRDVPNENDPRSFISVRFFREGEAEPGTNFAWEEDTYEIVTSRSDGTQTRTAAADRRRVAAIIAEEMTRDN